MERSLHVSDVVFQRLSLTILGHVVEIVDVGLVVAIVMAVHSIFADGRLKILLAIGKRRESEGSRCKRSGNHRRLRSGKDKTGKHLSLKKNNDKEDASSKFPRKHDCKWSFAITCF